MKKVLKAAMALCMILCLAVPAFAAMGPAKSNGDIVEAGVTTNKEGKVIQPKFVEVSEAVEFDVFVEHGGDIEFSAEEPAPNMAALSVIYQQDIQVNKEDLPVKITFDVSEAHCGPNDALRVMHYNAAANKWEQVGPTLRGALTSIEVTFTDLSPVTIVKETGSVAPSGTGTGTGTGTAGTGTGTPAQGPAGTTSPQTGMDMTMIYVGVAVFVAAGAVALVAGKKKNA